MARYRLEVSDTFSAAHQLMRYQGKCENIHGHNWKVTVSVSGENLNETGFIIDFGDLKKYLAEILIFFDHRNLNELPPFDTENPTAEILAREVYRRIEKLLPKTVRLDAVSIWESDRSCCTYME